MIFAKTTYYLSLNIKFFCISILVFCNTLNAQDNTNYNTVADSIIKLNITDYNVLEYTVGRNRYDTLKMKVFKTKSINNKYKAGEVFANIMLGNQYRNKSLFPKAEQTLLDALQLSKNYNLIEYEIVSLNMLGVVYRRQAMVKEALDYHQNALQLADRQTNKTKSISKSVAVSYNSMGNIYLELKEYNLALENFNKSLAIEKAANNKLGLAINYNNIGFIYEAKDSLELALKNYKISLDYNNQINSTIGKVISNNSIGSIYLKQNKPELALATIKPTIALAEATKDQFYISMAYINLGWAQNELNLLQQAKTNLDKGLQIATTYNLQSILSTAKYQISNWYEKQGNHLKALKFYKEAAKLEEEISGKNNSEYVNTLRIRYESEKKSNQILELASANKLAHAKLDQSKKTTYFLILGLILTALATFLFFRQRQLKSEKKILRLEQDMLRNQMNPHFIFNSLNSIKLYIINNEKENAVYYLNKFSKLIRKILIASTEKEITLTDELETMDLYMNIENIRFSNQIHFKTIVDDNVNTDNIKIPSLILQPFLENALWHGLSSKKDNKFINLLVSKINKNYVTISISDNGIGREASQKIKEKKLLKQKSLGIDITKQRLANFSKNYTENYDLMINDLYDSNNQASGTCVVLKLPIIPLQNLKTA